MDDLRRLPATPRKLRRARADGDVARSRLLPVAVLGLAAAAAFSALGASWLDALASLTRDALSATATLPPPSALPDVAWGLVAPLVAPVLATLTLVWAVAALADLVQVGPLFTLRSLTPRAARLGSGRIFHRDRAADVLLGLVVAALALAVAAVFVRDALPQTIALVYAAHPALAVARILDLVAGLAARLGLAVLAFALVDVWLQRQRRLKRLRMTPREVERERRDVDGDPNVRRARRAIQRRAQREGGLDAVPGAALVLSDASAALAVAWRPDGDAAPALVALGFGPLAEAIRARARRHRVPIEHNPALVDLLATLPVGSACPRPVLPLLAEAFRRNGLAPTRRA